jgi:hypothetical protein
MKTRISMTNLIQDEDVEALIAHCSTREEFLLGVKSLARLGRQERNEVGSNRAN